MLNRQHFVFGIVLLLYTVLSLYQLELPGLHYDEAFEAVPALQILKKQPVALFRNSGLALGGQRYPLMTQDYIGALNTYATLPFIYVFGPTSTALRLPSIIIGLMTLGLAYSLTTRLTGQPFVGLAAAFLLAVDPTFIFWNRQGIFVTAVTAPIGLGAAYCWLRRFQAGSIRWSIAGAFLFGLGLYAKFLFVWLIAALIGATILFNLPKLIQQKRGLLKPLVNINILGKEAPLILLAFLFGLWPLLLYNLQTGGTFLSITENAQTSYYGVDNSALGPNLIERVKQFVTVLNGSHLWYLGDIKSNPVAPAIFAIVLGGSTAAHLLTPQSFANSKRLAQQPPGTLAVFPFLVIGLVILASIQTVSALWTTHFAILMPWPAIAIASGGWYSLKTLQRFRPNLPQQQTRLILGLVVLLLAGSNLSNTLSYHRSLTESGGLSAHSDAIYDLGDWLATAAQNSGGQVSVVAMDWGLAAPIIYLTGSQVRPVEVFGYAWEGDIELTSRLEDFIHRPETFYLWRAPDEVIFDRSQEFKALYRPLALEETIEDAFYERSGRPILGVTRLVPCGTPGVQSPEPAAHCP